MVVNEKHLLVEVLLEVILDEGFFERGSSLPSIHLLSLQHFVELSLATRQKQLPKVHLRVLRIIKLFEKAHAELDIQVEELRLCRALHENNLHQLLHQRRVVVEVIHELLLHPFKILFGNFVEQDPELADLGGELVVRLLLGSEHRGRVQFELPLLVGQYKQGHVVGSCSAFVLEAQHEVD